MRAVWAPGSLWCAGVKVTVVPHGEHPVWPLPEDAEVILVGNHASHLDIPILTRAFRWAPRFVAKLELGRVPLLAYYIRRTGSVLIDRAKSKSAARSIDQAVEAATTGAPLAFFAEGTRSSDGVIAPFRNGAFVVARRAKLPVVPVAIVGSNQCLPKGQLMPSPGKVTVVVGPPMPPPEGGSAAAFAKQVRAVVGEMHVAHGGAGLA
ncbi:MAG: lysophospholipid acyltransferase family protein [Planctomycetota bacterium]